ncbi:MAG: methyltransferase domain-containing protein [Cyanobacteria bacterium J06632_3]
MLSEYKRAILNYFNHRRGDSAFHKAFASRLVEIANLKKGDFVLDVATGTGLAAIAAAERVGPQGHVLGTDFAVGALQQARLKVAASTLKNISFKEVDVDEQILSESQFNAILCSSAMAYFTDIPTVLQRWYKGLKSGGLVAFSCFHENSPSAGVLFRKTIKRHGITIPNPNQPLGTPERCRQALQAAAFQDINIITEQFGTYLKDGERAWTGNANSAFGLQNANWPEEKLQTCRQEYLSAIAAASGEKGYWNDMTAFFVVARKY